MISTELTVKAIPENKPGGQRRQRKLLRAYVWIKEEDSCARSRGLVREAVSDPTAYAVGYRLVQTGDIADRLYRGHS